MDRLSGRNAVVTGAARGIGLAISEAFVREGARVLMSDIDGEALRPAAERLLQPWCADRNCLICDSMANLT